MDFLGVGTTLFLVLKKAPPARLVSDINAHAGADTISHAIVESLVLGELPLCSEEQAREVARRIMGSYLLQSKPLRLLYVERKAFLLG